MSIDHKRASIADQIALVGELEHIRRHALRSAQIAESDNEFYANIANKAKSIRRMYMNDHFELSETDHCLCKASASLRQLIYETLEDDYEYLPEIDELVDEIWTKATGVDMSGCEACRNEQKSDDD